MSSYLVHHTTTLCKNPNVSIWHYYHSLSVGQYVGLKRRRGRKGEGRKRRGRERREVDVSSFFNNVQVILDGKGKVRG